jgi:hypothetical protein
MYDDVLHHESELRDDIEHKRVAYPFFVLHRFFLARHQLYEAEHDAAGGAGPDQDDDRV